MRKELSPDALFVFDSCFSGSIFAMSSAVPENITHKTASPVRQLFPPGARMRRFRQEHFAGQFIAALNGEGDTNGDGYITGANWENSCRVRLSTTPRARNTRSMEKSGTPI